MKKTLIVVDMQNDFISGSLGSSEAESIVENVRNKINQYYKNGFEIIYTRDTHSENYLQTSEGKKLPVPHCIKGSKGWQIADGLYKDGCEIVDKEHFGWTGWDKYSFESVEIVGLCTDICVVSNALIIKSFFPDAEIVIDKSCCAGVSKKSHESALETLKMCQIDII